MDISSGSDCQIVFETINQHDHKSSRKRRLSKEEIEVNKRMCADVNLVDIDADRSGDKKQDVTPKIDNTNTSNESSIREEEVVEEDEILIPITKCYKIEVVITNANRYKLTESALNKHFSSFGKVIKVYFLYFSSRRNFALINLTSEADIDKKTFEGNHSIEGEMAFVTIKEKVDKDPDKLLDWNARYSKYKIPMNRLEELGTVDRVNHTDIMIAISVLEKKMSMQDVMGILREKLLLTKRDHDKRNKLIKLIENVLIENNIACKCKAYGSSANQLGFKNADIDIFVELIEMGNGNSKLDHDIAVTMLQDIQIILQAHFKMFIPPPFGSRVPIVQINFEHKLKDIKEHKQAMRVDISVTSPLGVHNSKLISFLCQLEPRFESMAILIRYWAKKCGFIGSPSMSSYSWTMLVLYYCQQLPQPLLPSIAQLCTLAHEPLMVGDWDVSVCTDLDKVPKTDNKQSLDELLIGFFQFYASFDFSRLVICPREGKMMKRSEFLDEFSLDTKFKMSGMCCIQDVFDLDHNLTCHVKDDLVSKMCSHIDEVSQHGIDHMWKFDLFIASTSSYLQYRKERQELQHR